MFRSFSDLISVLTDTLEESRRLVRAKALLHQGLMASVAESDDAPPPAPPRVESDLAYDPAFLAAGCAHRAVSLRIQDDPSGAWFIDRCIRGFFGLTWNTVQVGPTARAGVPYKHDGDFAWCLAFVAAMYGLQGLKADIRRKLMPSTYRLWNAYRHDSRRFITDPQQLRQGDIVILGPCTPNAAPWGEHGVLFYKTAGDGHFISIEGNAKGYATLVEAVEDNGKNKYEGVVFNRRPLYPVVTNPQKYAFLYAIRFQSEDIAKYPGVLEADRFFTR